MIEPELINQLKKNDRKAQRIVYDQLSGKLNTICKRYLKREDEIQDALIESFYTIFTKVDQLKKVESFEAWSKRIVINQCLRKIRKRINFTIHIDNEKDVAVVEPSDDLEYEDIISFVNQLPDGCQTVFNLYVIEGFSHQEIADQLSISVGTSKSQLSFAKKKLQQMMNQYSMIKNEIK